MLKMAMGLVAVVAFIGDASAQSKTPIKTCGALDLKCINANFQQLQNELDAANGLIAKFTTRADALEKQINDQKSGLAAVNNRLDDKTMGLTALNNRLDDKTTGLAALKDSIATTTNKLDGNLQVREVNRGVCLEWFSTGGPGAAFLPCDKGRVEQVFKLDPR